MPPPIAIYGAVARFNYGDLLFPLILQRALRDAGCDRPIHAVGLRRSDLSRYGAMATEATRWLVQPENLPDGSKVIIAGGEVLAAGWGRLFSHLWPPSFGDQLYGIVSRLANEQRLDSLGKRRAGVPWNIPFCLNPTYFANRVEVLFNAVGGSGLAARDTAWRAGVSAAIDQARYASVRDRETFNLLGGSRSRAELRPDSAAVMRDFFPRDWLRTKVRADLLPILDGQPYLCFQLHRYFTAAKLRRFALELDRCQRESGLRIVLLPIGRAVGHSDRVSLVQIRRAMTTTADLPEGLGVFDIMALLAHSAGYAGTSLHGLITAMAFRRPYAMLGTNPKCESCLAEWAPRALRERVPANDFFTSITERLQIDEAILEEGSERFCRASREGLNWLVDAALDD